MNKVAAALVALPIALPVALTAGPASAESSAEATSVAVDGVIVISESRTAHDEEGEAEATSLEILGNEVSGGSQSGDGASSGSLYDSGATPLGTLAIGAWEATSDGAGSSASAGLVEAAGPEGTVAVGVLESSSTSRADGAEASSTGLRLVIGDDLEFRILHTEQSTDAEGQSALAELNDTRIGTEEQFGDCRLELEPVVRLLCLFADRTTPGEDGLASGVADLDVADGSLTSSLFSAGSGTKASRPASPPARRKDSKSAPSSPDAGPDATAPGRLPRTGASAALFVVAFLCGSVGVVLRWTGFVRAA